MSAEPQARPDLDAGASGETTPADPDGTSQKAVERFELFTHWITVLGLVLTIGLVVVGLATGTLRSVDAVREFLGQFGLWAPVVFTFIQAIQCISPVVPGGVGVVAGPILFGPVVGTLCNYVGQSLGSTAAFLIARRLGRPLVESRMRSDRTRKYLAWLDHPHYTRYFALAIVLPVAPDDLLCYLSGLTSMRKRTFLAIILLGKPWSIMAYSFGTIALLNYLFPGLGL